MPNYIYQDKTNMPLLKTVILKRYRSEVLAFKKTDNTILKHHLEFLQHQIIYFTERLRPS